jgi:signal transduction histidine kinase
MDFDIPIGTTGDCYARYLVRVEEMRQSAKIMKQAIEKMPKGPVMTDDLKIAPPSRSDMKSSMEALILSSANGLLVLLNDILDFSKIEAGELRLEAVPFNMKEVLQEIIHLLSPLAGEKGLILVNYYAATVPSMVIGDPLRVKQIVTNLIGNALKFTNSGRVKLSVDAQQTGEKGHYLYTFTVEDTGIGISPDAQKRLFKKFSQADDSTRRQYGGTGLGLAISQELAELMGGVITLTSEFGKGTVVIRAVAAGYLKWERDGRPCCRGYFEN